MADYTLHEPRYDGTVRGDWSPPDRTDFEADDLAAIDDHFLVSASGFEPDGFDDLALPVVEPGGDLNLAALRAAHDRADEFDDETERAVRTLVRRLADEQFDRTFG